MNMRDELLVYRSPAFYRIDVGRADAFAMIILTHIRKPLWKDMWGRGTPVYSGLSQAQLQLNFVGFSYSLKKKIQLFEDIKNGANLKTPRKLFVSY